MHDASHRDSLGGKKNRGFCTLGGRIVPHKGNSTRRSVARADPAPPRHVARVTKCLLCTRATHARREPSRLTGRKKKLRFLHVGRPHRAAQREFNAPFRRQGRSRPSPARSMRHKVPAVHMRHGFFYNTCVFLRFFCITAGPYRALFLNVYMLPILRCGFSGRRKMGVRKHMRGGGGGLFSHGARREEKCSKARFPPSPWVLR